MTTKTAKQRIARYYYRCQKDISDPIPTSNPITEPVETRTEPIETRISMLPSVDILMPYVPQKGNGKGNGKSNGNGIPKNGAGNYQHGFTVHEHEQRRFKVGQIDHKRQKPPRKRESIRTFFAEMQYN